MVPIAHDSGGPREDIVVPEPAPPGPAGTTGGAGAGAGQPTGYRCRSLEQYADAICEVLAMGQVERMRLAAAARRRAAQFSDQRFQRELMACLEDVLPGGRRSPAPANVVPAR